jgi:hypothetical protein
MGDSRFYVGSLVREPVGFHVGLLAGLDAGFDPAIPVATQRNSTGYPTSDTT